MKVIIKDEFYEFQNENTDAFFNEQKAYLSNLIQSQSGEENLEALLTALFSLYNLTEALIHKVVDENGKDAVVKVLNAKELK